MCVNIGKNFLCYVPTADPTRPAAVAALRRYVGRARENSFIPDLLEQRAQDLEDAGLPARDAYVQALCQTYTKGSWPFEHVNRALRSDIAPLLEPLAPYIRAMLGIFDRAPREAADLRLFRRTTLGATRLAMYEPGSGLH